MYYSVEDINLYLDNPLLSGKAGHGASLDFYALQLCSRIDVERSGLSGAMVLFLSYILSNICIYIVERAKT